MSFQRTFEASTKEAAIELAQAYVAALDKYTQPTVSTPTERDGVWRITVIWYGLD